MNRRADQYRPLFAQLGERVKGHRKALGLSLEEVGNRAGLTKSYVWEIEHGSSKNPTVAAVWGLASALGVSPETLLGLRTDKPTLSPFAMKIAAMIDAKLKAPGTQPDSGAGPSPVTRGSDPAVARTPTRNEDQSDG